jgi:predicted nucleic acid-binding protein
MSVLLDTNILTRLCQHSHPQHSVAEAAIRILQSQGEPLHVVPQNLYEFWAVATRPIAAANGLGFTVNQAKSEIVRIRSLFVILPDVPSIFGEWERLVDLYEVKGKTTHDARLVAAMIVHDVTKILTFNDRDFSRYVAIGVVNPATLTALSHP